MKLLLVVTVTSFIIVELAFPILVIKTFNSCLLKFIGKVTSVLSEVVPHCRLMKHSGELMLGKI